jgi:hypothetical protein
MDNKILGTGIACIIAAIVGGGLQLFGINIPVLNSIRRQLLLASFGALLVLWQVTPLLHRTSTENKPPTPPATANASPSLATGETPTGPFWVIRIADPVHPDGRYFYFDAAGLDASHPGLIKDQYVYLVSKNRDSGFGRAVIFRPQEHGNPHGRLLPTGKKGDWHTGESFYLVPKDLGKWNPKEQ